MTVDPVQPQVEFEFTTWVLPKATADFHSCSGQSSFLLFVYVCKWVAGRKPPGMAMAGGSHCWSPFHWWPWTQAQVVNSNSTSTGKEPRRSVYIFRMPRVRYARFSWVQNGSDVILFFRWIYRQDLLPQRFAVSFSCAPDGRAVGTRDPSHERCNNRGLWYTLTRESGVYGTVQWRIQDFLRGRLFPIICLQCFFAENCMEMKEFGSGEEGGTSLAAVWIRQSYTCLVAINDNVCDNTEAIRVTRTRTKSWLAT